MKQFKKTLALVSLLVLTNSVIAQNQRTVANPGASIEVRSVEDVVKNADDFVSVTPGSKARKMTSKSLKDKSIGAASQVAGVTTNQEPAQASNENRMKKFKRFSVKEGEKKNKKNR